MPEATQRVPSSVVEYSDHRIYRIPKAVAATYFGGAMVAIEAVSGLAVKAAAVAGLIFDGILEQTVRIQINAEDTVNSMALDQSKKLPVLRPFRFRMYIAGAVTAADLNKKVYVNFDNEVVIAAPANPILVGRIDQVLAPNEVLVAPVYGWYPGP